MTQLTALIQQLRQAKRQRNRQLLEGPEELETWERHQQTEKLNNRLLAVEDADFAEYPFPTVSRHNMAEVIAKARQTKGLKLRALAITSATQNMITLTQTTIVSLWETVRVVILTASAP